MRDELKAAREEIDRLEALLLDMVPRAELMEARKVCNVYMHDMKIWAQLRTYAKSPASA